MDCTECIHRAARLTSKKTTTRDDEDEKSKSKRALPTDGPVAAVIRGKWYVPATYRNWKGYFADPANRRVRRAGEP